MESPRTVSFASLPRDLYPLLFAYLPMSDRKRLERVSKGWRSLLRKQYRVLYVSKCSGSQGAALPSDEKHDHTSNGPDRSIIGGLVGPEIADRLGMNDFPSVPAALAVARPGDKIILKRGLHIADVIVTVPYIEILGETGNPDDVRLEQWPSNNGTMVIRCQGRVRVACLTMMKKIAGYMSTDMNTLEVFQGTLVLEKCKIRADYTAVVVEGGHLIARKCSIKHGKLKTSLIFRDGGSGDIVDCLIAGHKRRNGAGRSGGRRVPSQPGTCVRLEAGCGRVRLYGNTFQFFHTALHFKSSGPEEEKASDENVVNAFMNANTVIPRPLVMADLALCVGKGAPTSQLDLSKPKPPQAITPPPLTKHEKHQVGRVPALPPLAVQQNHNAHSLPTGYLNLFEARRLHPENSELNLVLVELQQHIEHHIRDTRHFTTNETAVASLADLRCPVDDLCPHLFSCIVTSILRAAREGLVAQLYVPTPAIGRLISAICVKYEAPHRTNLLAHLLQGCENWLDSPARFSSRYTEHAMHTWNFVCHLLLNVAADQPMLWRIVVLKLVAYFRSPVPGNTSAVPYLYFDLLWRSLGDFSRSKPLFSFIYHQTFKQPSRLDTRSRFKLRDIFDSKFYGGISPTPIQRKRLAKARVFLVLVANARRIADMNNSKRAALANLPIDLLLLIAAAIAPQTEDLRMCFNEAYEGWNAEREEALAQQLYKAYSTDDVAA